MANQQILDYIRQQLERGVKQVDITSSLITSGWTSSDIEEGFRIVSGEGVIPPRPQTGFSIDQDIPGVRRYNTMINFSELKKLCIYTFIGGIIASATLAVVTVLSGTFGGELTAKVFSTLGIVIVHSLISLAFIWDDSRRHTFNTLPFFVNTVFCLVVVSLFASVFNIWGIISGETLLKTYSTFFVIVFASLHADALSKASRKENYIDNIIYANYVFIALVVAMLLPTIYISNADVVLGELYFRFLAAASIIDGTLSVLTIIFYKLYMQKHPELIEHEQKRTRGLSIWIWAIVAYLVFQMISTLFYSVFFSGNFIP